MPKPYSASILLILCVSLAHAQFPTPVGVDTVKTVPMSQTVPVVGRFVPLQSGAVAARSPGPVARVLVQVGDHVEQGDIIAELDASRLQAALALQDAQLAELSADLKTAQATAKLARQELNRMEKLRNSAAFTRYDYDKRVQELAVARAKEEEAQARINRGQVARQLAQLELNDRQIKAPFRGVVTQRHTSAGAWLRVGDPVITLINNLDLEIEADVPAARLTGLQPGTAITVQLAASTPEQSTQSYQAQVRSVIPDENPAARTRPVRFQPEPQLQQQALAVNQDITLLIPTSKRSEVLSVSKDAVIRRGTQAMVFVVSNGTAQPRTVQLGQAVGDRLQVLDGLQDGEVVVIRGNERLRPGQTVAYPGMPTPKTEATPETQPAPDTESAS